MAFTFLTFIQRKAIQFISRQTTGTNSVLLVSQNIFMVSFITPNEQQLVRCAL